MPFHIDYRPTTLAEVTGNADTIAAIRALLKRKDKPHSFLFTGISGGGKTTLGRILATELGAYDPKKGENACHDYIELNSADARGVDNIRAIIKNMRMAPISGTARVWLFDECHKITGDAQETMLKMVENPPPHCYFILCTTEPEKLKVTLKRRLTTFEINPLSAQEMRKLLTRVCENEEVEVPVPVIKQIIADAGGSAGMALQVLDKVSGLPPEKMLKTAESTARQLNQVIDLCRILMSTASKANWNKVTKILTGLAENEPESIRRAVLGYCSSILLKADNPKAFLIMEAFEEPFYNTGRPGLVMACYRSLYAE